MCRNLTKTLDYLDVFARFKDEENIKAVERLLNSHTELEMFERSQLGKSDLPRSLGLESAACLGLNWLGWAGFRKSPLSEHFTPGILGNSRDDCGYARLYLATVSVRLY